MKILTLNTWQERGPWKERWEIIFECLREFAPDIVAFQEVFNRTWAEEVQRRAGYPFLVFPEEPGGLMFLSRYPVKDSACLTMAAQAPSEEYKRYALYARLEADSREVAVFNTHLSWRTPETEIRQAQVGELLDFVRSRAGKMPNFATGDFNASPDTKEIYRMMLEGGFIDLYGVKNPADPGLTWDNRNPFAAGSSIKMPDRRIDFIFMQGVSITKVGSVQRVLTEPVNGIYASDHFGVLVEISL